MSVDAKQFMEDGFLHLKGAFDNPKALKVGKHILESGLGARCDNEDPARELIPVFSGENTEVAGIIRDFTSAPLLRKAVDQPALQMEKEFAFDSNNLCPVEQGLLLKL